MVEATFEGDAWSARAFKAIDTESKGYVVKDEILELIKG